MSSSRMNYLDSLRGIAALVVVVCHCTMLYPGLFDCPHVGLLEAVSSHHVGFYVAEKLRDGARAAVILFFVLSGFVLALSLERGTTNFSSFLIKRLFRIYPLFSILVLFSWLLHILLGFHNPGSFEAMQVAKYHYDLSLLTIWKHLAMFGVERFEWLDGPMWTLVHEMRIALLFPVLLMLTRRYGLVMLASALLLSLGTTLISLETKNVVVTGFSEQSVAGSLNVTAYFIFQFVLGAFVAINRVRMISYVAKSPAWAIACLSALSLALILKADFDNHVLFGCAGDLLKAFGAAGVLLICMSVPTVARLLNFAPLIWLGGISYSLYLVHMPILYIVSQTMGQECAPVIQALLTVFASFPIAHLTKAWIEEPFNKIGQSMIARKPHNYISERATSGMMPASELGT